MIYATTPLLESCRIKQYFGLVTGEAILGADAGYETIDRGQNSSSSMLMVSVSGTAVRIAE